MNKNNRVFFLVTPLVLTFLLFVLIMDGTKAFSTKVTLSAPLEKRTAVSATSDLPVCTGTATKILPMGDSITYGEESSTNAGFRLPLYLALRNSGYDIDFVGSQTGGPAEPGFDDDHEGRPGWEIDSFFGLGSNNGPITFWLNNQNPEILLIHVGTNDMSGADPVPQAETDFNELISEIEEWEVGQGISLTLVTAEIINRACPNNTAGCLTTQGNTTDFNDFIATRFNGISNRFVVDMEDGAGIVYSIEPGGDFSAEDDNPGIHPNDEGYGKMADVWFEQLIAVLPSPCDTDLLMSPASTMTKTAGVTFTYQVVASGYPTPTNYNLLSAPSGMMIDNATGKISWLPGFEQVGSHTAVVEVTNGEETVSESYDIDVVTGDMVVYQTPLDATVVNGDSIQFTVDITNTGSQTLSTIPVLFPEAPSCDENNVGPLTAGQSTAVTCTFTPSADVTFPVWVTATNDLSEEVSRIDTSSVGVINPQFTFEKSASETTIFPNEDITFTFTITNSGDVSLSNIMVSDPAYPMCDNATIGTLDVDEGSSYTCLLTDVTEDIFNTAYITGTHSLGTISDSDSAIVDVISPAIEIAIDPSSQQILSGGTANFTVTITNTGDVTLTNVTVVDNGSGSCSQPAITLNPTDTNSFNCSDTNVTGDMLKEVTVTGDHTGGQISASADTLVDVFSNEIDVIKFAPSAYALTGSDVTFTIIVTNTSGTNMSNVDINDPLGSCSESTSLSDGASHQLNCTILNATSDIANTVFVTGTLPSGSVSSSDLFVVNVIDPSIKITVTPHESEVYVDEPAVLDVVVENTGDVTLTAVQVSGLTGASCNPLIGTLNANESHSYTCTTDPLPFNTAFPATAVGTDPANGTVTDSDNTTITVKLYTLHLPYITSGD